MVEGGRDRVGEGVREKKKGRGCQREREIKGNNELEKVSETERVRVIVRNSYREGGGEIV